MDINVLWPGWETVRLIGRGSFGAVYEIQRDVFGDVEKAALKVISIPQNASDIEELYSDGYDDESITSTFQSHLKSIVAEYTLMRKMNGSANIVNCDDIRYVQHDDGFGWDIFIKMELLTPLAKSLPSEITDDLVIKVAKDMCAALMLCKRHGIIHRDIKPQNIFVSPNGDYKLGDFGIAKTVEKTMGGTKIGTYKYMAPEVYNNQPYGAGADIYSLGLVLYWLLNERRLPFLPLPPATSKAGEEEEARNRRFSGEPIPALVHGNDELKRIVLKACAYNPEERYQSAEEMYQDLSNIITDAERVRQEELRRQQEIERLRRIQEENECLRREHEEIERLRKQQEEQERIHREQEEQTRLQKEREEHEWFNRERETIEHKPKGQTVDKIAKVIQNVIDVQDGEGEPHVKTAPIVMINTHKGLIKKAALILSGLILYFAIAGIFIRRIITGNMMFGHLYEDTRDGVETITALLKTLIGATTDEYGLCRDQWGITLNPPVTSTNFANACYLIFPALFMLLVPILSGGIWITKAFGKYRQKPIIKQQNTSRVKKITHGIAMVVIYLLTAEAYIARLITGNLMLRELAALHGYGGAGETLRGIISFLKTLIGAGDGITTMDQFGIGLYAFASRNLMSVCYLIVPSLFMLVTPIVAGINYVIRVTRKNASNNV